MELAKVLGMEKLGKPDKEVQWTGFRNNHDKQKEFLPENFSRGRGKP